MGAVTIALVGSKFILSGIEHSPAELAAMSPANLLAYRVSEANMVKTPYLVITGIFLFIAVLIALTRLPEISESRDAASTQDHKANLMGTLAFPHLIKGVLAQFFYVGAQVGVASFIIRFTEFTMPGTFEKSAAHYLQAHLAGFMIGRFAGSAIMQKIAPPRLLSLFAGGSLLCLLVVLLRSGEITVWAIVLVGFFHSIMFPTIFALSLKNLGPYTKLGSSLLVMAIIGGAVCPLIMGRISDMSNIQYAFVVPLICHAYVFYFAVSGYKPSSALAAAQS
jgi:FHS family L-fucose permease-like MFS transporter